MLKCWRWEISKWVVGGAGHPKAAVILEHMTKGRSGKDEDERSSRVHIGVSPQTKCLNKDGLWEKCNKNHTFSPP